MRSTFCCMLILTCSLSIQAQNFVLGDIEYSVATYSEEIFIKEKHGIFFDSLLRKPILVYFKNTKIKRLPAQDNDKSNKITPSESHVLEPLFINLSTFDGIYAKRIFALKKTRKIPHFRCGYWHFLFIIADDKYYNLTRDSLKNSALINKLMKASFDNIEIKRMIEYFDDGVFCEDYTFLPPYYIKKDEEILFDITKVK